MKNRVLTRRGWSSSNVAPPGQQSSREAFRKPASNPWPNGMTTTSRGCASPGEGAIPSACSVAVFEEALRSVGSRTFSLRLSFDGAVPRPKWRGRPSSGLELERHRRHDAVHHVAPVAVNQGRVHAALDVVRFAVDVVRRHVEGPLL